MNSKVISSKLGFPHCLGSMRFAQWGPNMIPKAVATIASPAYNFSLMRALIDVYCEM